MTERKRAGARRSLAAAAGTKKERRRNDDTATGAVIEHVHHPNQIPLVESGPAAATPPVTASPAPAHPRPSGSKYTAVLDDDTLDAFEHLTRISRRRLGRHVDKIEVLSALLLLAADDVSLRDQVVSAIGERTPRR